MSEQTIALESAHDRGVIEIKAALAEAAAGNPDLDLAEFSVQPVNLKNPGAEILKPDGFIRFSSGAHPSPSEALFYLEFDRSTEPLRMLMLKAQSYSLFRYMNAEKPFRVLFVTKSVERRNNLLETLLLMQRPVATLVYASTISEVTSDPLGPVWVRALDYQAAIANTAFELSIRSTFIHGRMPSRDRIVEMRIEKQRLFPKKSGPSRGRFDSKS